MKNTVLTCFNIDNKKFYIFKGLHKPEQVGRYIRKHTLQPITDLQQYIKDFCKLNNTGVILKTYECVTV